MRALRAHVGFADCGKICCLQIVLFAFAASGGVAPAPGNTNSPFEQFKAFLESPPIIEHIVVRQKVPSASGGSFAVNDGFAQSRNFRFFEGRWQPGAVFYRDLPSLESLTNCGVGPTLVATYGPHHWLNDSASWIGYWMHFPEAQDRTNDIIVTTQLRLQRLWDALGLGVQHLPPGLIHWTGNHFSAHSPTFKGLETFDITGDLFAAPNGLPESMKLQYTWNGRTAIWTNHYIYERQLSLPFLPNRIEQYWTGHGGIELGEYEILEIRTAREPLAEKAFDPTPFIKANRWETRVYTNGLIYSLQRSGALSFLMSQVPSHPVSSLAAGHEQAARTVAYAAFAGFNFWIFALAMRARKVNNIDKSTERKEQLAML
jgi:hypothetical protein